MTVPVLTAVTDAVWEADLVSAFERQDFGVIVVRRCVDLADLLAAATAYFVLQTVIIRQQGPDSPLRQAVGTDIKGKISPAFYVAGILSAQAIDRSGRAGIVIALACFIGPAIMWIIPDRRIDRMIRHHGNPD